MPWVVLICRRLKVFTHILPLIYEYGISKYVTNAYMSINKMAQLLSHFIVGFREKPYK